MPVRKGLGESDMAGVCSLSQLIPVSRGGLSSVPIKLRLLLEPLWALEPSKEESSAPKSPTQNLASQRQDGAHPVHSLGPRAPKRSHTRDVPSRI